MHVSSLELKNFKRFTDLTIDLSKLAQPPKLVLLIGANGSGKPSVFNGFDTLLKYYRAADGLFKMTLFPATLPLTIIKQRIKI